MHSVEARDKVAQYYYGTHSLYGATVDTVALNPTQLLVRVQLQGHCVYGANGRRIRFKPGTSAGSIPAIRTTLWKVEISLER